MSISSKIVYTVLAGDGSNKTFTFTFNADSADKVKLYRVSSAGVKTAVTSDYTVDLTTKIVTYPVSGDALASGEKLVIYRESDRVQDYAYTYGSVINAADFEAALDYLCELIQENGDKADRAVKVSRESGADPDELINSITENVSAAAASASAASVSAESAASSVTTAAAQAASASTYAGNASASAVAAAASAVEAAEAAGNVHITVDSALSATSENPVQNKVIKAALDLKASSSALATVATSGSYEDLSNKPTIPSISNKISYMYFDDIVMYDSISTYTPSTNITVYNKTNNRFYTYSGSAWGDAIEPVDGVLYISKDHQCILIYDDTEDTPTCVQAGVTIEDFDEIVTYTDISNTWTPSEAVKVYNTADHHIWKFEDSVWQDQGNARQDVLYVNWANMLFYVYDEDGGNMDKIERVIDTAPSSTSENAIQNKVITSFITAKGQSLTNASIEAKEVTIANIGTTFFDGQHIRVEFPYGNTSNYVTLNVNASGAKKVLQGYEANAVNQNHPFLPKVSTGKSAYIDFTYDSANDAWRYDNKIVSRETDKANYDITGSPTITAGTGNFTAGDASNYVTLDKEIPVASSTLSYVFKITTPATFTANTVLLGRKNAYTGMFFMVDASGNLTWYGSSNGTSNDIASGAATGITLSPSTGYYIKIDFDKTAGTYTPYYAPGKTNGTINWVSGTVISNSNALSAFTPLVGANATTGEYAYFGGSITLDNIAITVDGSVAWEHNGRHGVGKNWCARYTDGFIQMGGYSESTAITFLQEFEETNYTFRATPYDPGTDGAVSINIAAKTTSGITVIERVGASGTSTSIPFDWVAEGY